MSAVDKETLFARRAVSAFFFIDGAALGSFAPHIATVQHNLHLTSGALGVALLASPIGAVTTMPFSGFAIHRFGSRVTALIGGLLLCSVLPCLVAAPTLPLFALFLLCLGVVNGQMDVGMNTHSVVVQSRFNRPILSAVHGWFSVGGFAGGAGASVAAKLMVSPIAHLAVAGFSLAIGLLIAVRYMLPATVDSQGEGPKFAVPTGALLGIGILALIAFVSEGAIWDWTAVYLRNVLNSGVAVGAIGFGVFSLSMALGRFLGDSWIHKLGPLPVLQISGGFTAVGIWLALALPTPILAIVGFSLVGIGLANMVPILFKAAGSVPGIPAGTGLAAVTTCGYAGFLIGPPTIGFVAQARTLGFALGCLACLTLAVAVASARVLSHSDLRSD